MPDCIVWKQSEGLEGRRSAVKWVSVLLLLKELVPELFVQKTAAPLSWPPKLHGPTL
jgi:hypothetical protein